MDGLIAYALAKKYTDKVGQDIISAGFKVQVEDNRSILNRQGEEKVLYLLPKEYGSSQDGYDEFVYANRNWEWVGKTDVSLDYETLGNKPKFQTKGLEAPFDLSGINTSEDLESLIDANGNRVWKVNFDIVSRIPNYSIRFEQMESPNRLPWVTDLIGDTVFINEIADPNSDLSNKIFPANSIYPALGIEARGPIFIANITTFSMSIQLFTWKDFQDVSHIGYRAKTAYANWSDLIELGSGGAQIVSGVVNANGTITFTDSKGDSFTTSGESVIGPQGSPGQDYILTAQDKSDIADIVLSELPTIEGVLYGNQSN